MLKALVFICLLATTSVLIPQAQAQFGLGFGGFGLGMPFGGFGLGGLGMGLGGLGFGMPFGGLGGFGMPFFGKKKK